MTGLNYKSIPGYGQILANKGLILWVLLAAGVAYYLYRQGRKSGLVYIPDAKYPKGGSTIPSNWNPNPLAEELFRVMDGLFTLTGTKEAVFLKAYNLPNDEMLIALYNVFNTKYAAKGKGSLTQWIDDEVYFDYLLSVKTKLVDKLRSLNLK